MKKIILGGGLTGLSAFELNASKSDKILIDKISQLGGLTRSIYIDDFTYDYTGHFLHLSTFKRPSDISNKFNDNDWYQIEKKSFCYYKGKFINAPFQYNLSDLGDADSTIFFQSYLEAIKNKKEESKEELSLSQYFSNEFGELISNEFLRPYNEKLFATDLSKLNISGINRFFPQPDFEKIKSGALNNEKNTNNSAIYNSKFWYPKNDGISLLIKSLLPKEQHVLGLPDFIDIDSKVLKINGNQID